MQLMEPDMRSDDENILAEGSPRPMVSVCCITYNQAPYIAKALEGFQMQRTTFPYEVIVHDDASTDGTREILARYASKHPDLIFPIFQNENQYSRNVPISAEFVFKKARGKYIALCEGDDYWTDEEKLQWQVDFLEANPTIAMCTHEVIRNIDTGNDVRSLRRKLGVLHRYASLFGPLRAGNVLLRSLIGRARIESFDLTCRDKKRKENGATYGLEDFSDGKPHMSLCSMVLRKSVIDEYIGAFYTTPGAGHQSLLLMSAIAGGVAHFHKVSAVKNDQPTSVTQSPEHLALGRQRASRPETNEKLRRYQYFVDRVDREQRMIFERMIAAERERMGF